MAHLWVNAGKDGWALAELDGDAFVLTSETNRPVRFRRPTDGVAPLGQSGAAVLRRSGSGDRERCALLSPPAGRTVAVNGLPLSVGIRVLRDRDEIQMRGEPRMFISMERLARVEPYAGPPHARCDTEIQPGRPSVRCPRCRTA
jgi:hypothetical protein